MTNKTYNQYCGVAHALDIVGERWTLLVVRNLLIMPQRFSDLRNSLPGISTNILSDRLTVLERHEIVTTQYLPPPAASTVYQLTERGYELTQVLAAFAKWGSQTLGTPQKDQAVVMEGVCFMLQGMFWREEYVDTHITCNVHVKDDYYDETFAVALSKMGVNIKATSDRIADIKLHTGLESLNLLSSHQESLQKLSENGLVEIIGDEEKVAELYAWLS